MHEQVERITALQEVLVRRAEDAGDTYLPGYTHMQRAQPVMLSHHLLAHFWALGRDVDRWRDALDRASVSPLGAGALAGSSLPLDPADVAAELGFARPFENSLDAVSDRDFVAEALFVAALTQIHLSRIGEEIVLWATEEFGFIHLPDAYSTGSSMLPQKKNPDIAELARGKAGRVVGDLVGFLTTLKGLPLAYNRDLQEDKEPLFDALDTCAMSLRALAGMLDAVEFVEERMASGGRQLDDGGHRPGRAPRARGRAVPRRARRGRHAGAAVDRAGRALRRAGRDRPAIRSGSAAAARAGSRGAPADDTGRRRARRRSSPSSSSPATGWRSSAPGSRSRSVSREAGGL